MHQRQTCVSHSWVLLENIHIVFHYGTLTVLVFSARLPSSLHTCNRSLMVIPYCTVPHHTVGVENISDWNGRVHSFSYCTFVRDQAALILHFNLHARYWHHLHVWSHMPFQFLGNAGLTWILLCVWNACAQTVSSGSTCCLSLFDQSVQRTQDPVCFAFACMDFLLQT